MVIAPANTGRLVIKRTAVTKTAQRKRGRVSTLKETEDRETTIVVKKLMDPRIELIPAKCRLKIAISTLTPE
jgi:hypothetical protein